MNLPNPRQSFVANTGYGLNTRMALLPAGPFGHGMRTVGPTLPRQGVLSFGEPTGMYGIPPTVNSVFQSKGPTDLDWDDL